MCDIDVDTHHSIFELLRKVTTGYLLSFSDWVLQQNWGQLLARLEQLPILCDGIVKKISLANQSRVDVYMTHS